VPNFVEIGQTVADIRQFLNFSSWRHPGFLNFGNVKGQNAQEAWNIVIVPNFAAIGLAIPEEWRFFDFSKMATAAILDFKNF